MATVTTVRDAFLRAVPSGLINPRVPIVRERDGEVGPDRDKSWEGKSLAAEPKHRTSGRESVQGNGSGVGAEPKAAVRVSPVGLVTPGNPAVPAVELPSAPPVPGAGGGGAGIGTIVPAGGGGGGRRMADTESAGGIRRLLRDHRRPGRDPELREIHGLVRGVLSAQPHPQHSAARESALGQREQPPPVGVELDDLRRN